MRKPLVAIAFVLAIAIAAGVSLILLRNKPAPDPEGFVGSESCRDCHEEFYELWAPSHHGLAMQPYTAELGQSAFTPQDEALAIGQFRYRADLSSEPGVIVESGPEGDRRYPIEYVMGGKNVYYFLTPYLRGRLQTMPLAYDLNTKSWFDTAASGVRHFPDLEDAPLHWTDRPYTFNTSCYGCHVSQLTINYNLDEDSYDTSWSEPGINCETCHGPAGEHVRFCRESEEACTEDVRLIKTSVFDVPQTNTMCAPCHAKMVAISDDFRPGDRYFDHYDLVTLEHRDFYPDGRDLGENYTMTTWSMSPCVKSGKLDCVDCHTSSGRYRFVEDTNQACMPCHADKVGAATAHTNHPAGSSGNECVSCHMPKTMFARMVRSDHSMRPPTPAATIAFESPNACNICHTDRDAQWADKLVRQWRTRDYQKPVLELASLIDEARKDNWGRLDEMLAYILDPGREEVAANSFVRLLRNCPDARKWPVLIQATEDESPLIRASAAEALAGNGSPDAAAALIRATGDDYRLVRIRAAAALAGGALRGVTAEQRASVEKATGEFLVSMRTRPDDDSSHTNLGNYYMNNGDLQSAIGSFETAAALNPHNVATRVNLSLAYNLNGENDKAERSLRQALETEPANPAASFNLGLLLGEMGRKEEAKEALRVALKADANMAPAAYNLCVLEAETSIESAIRWCRSAAESRPEEPKYGYTVGFYEAQRGNAVAAIQALEDVVARHPGYRDAYGLLARVYESRGDAAGAASVYRRAEQVSR